MILNCVEKSERHEHELASLHEQDQMLAKVMILEQEAGTQKLPCRVHLLH